tara:strand:- start:407 stop:610 length:204 start_codon:yes stop_codon:yes gene_type:complete
MSHSNHKHDHHQQHQHKKKGGVHKDWKTWVVIGLMLLSMLMYVISDDESYPPGDPDAGRQPVPAAAE